MESTLFSFLSALMRQHTSFGQLQISISTQSAAHDASVKSICVRLHGLPNSVLLKMQAAWQSGQQAALLQVLFEGNDLMANNFSHFLTTNHGQLSLETSEAPFHVAINLLADLWLAQDDTYKMFEVANSVPTQATAFDGEANLAKSSGAIADRDTVVVVADLHSLSNLLFNDLSNKFKILFAQSDRDGWRKIIQLHPSVVICELHADNIDGFGLCKKIKSDSRTKHIPIILLTQNANENEQLASYQIGVSDYMEMPINATVLYSRITNLLHQYNYLKAVFQKQISLFATTTTSISENEKMLRRAIQLIEDNMDKADFSVNELSRALFMTRVGLYKKLLVLTGKTPVEFIRNHRLSKAATLLTDSSKTVAEVAYYVGFNNPKIFSKFFKNNYGVLPSQYRKNLKI